MDPFEAASQTLRSALETDRIGSPVAVRVVVHLAADHGLIERIASRALEEAAGWLKGEPKRLTARGGVEAGQITALVRFAGGQTALVSAGSSGMGAPLMEIVVIGNRGVLSWEGGHAFPFSDVPKAEGDLPEKAAAFLRAVRASLRSGKSTGIGRDAAAGRPPSETKSWMEGPAQPPVLPKPPAARRGKKPPYGLLLVAGDYTHQPNYAEELTADKRCRLVGLTDEEGVPARRKKLNEQLAARLGIPMLPDLDAALRRDDVDIVSICAEPSRRGRIIVKAAEAGKHLYLDKPLAGSLQDADAIGAAIRKAGVVSHMFSHVHTPWGARAKEIVTSGMIGDLTAVHFDLSFAKGPAGTADLKRPRRETPVPKRYELKDSKRELSNVGVYPLVILAWLLDRRVRGVSASTGNYFFAEHQRDGLEDFGQALLEVEGGVTATISVGRIGWRSHPSYGLNRISLIGSKGTASVAPHRPRVEVWADVEPWTSPERNPEDPMGMWKQPPGSRFTRRPKHAWVTPPAVGGNTDAAFFLDCIEKGRESDVSAALAAHVTEILLAAYRSAATGNVIKLPLPR